jgi:hypothetical protein
MLAFIARALSRVHAFEPPAILRARDLLAISLLFFFYESVDLFL